MKSILFAFFLILAHSVVFAQTTPLVYTILTSDLNRPGAGAEQWNGYNIVNIPTQGTNTPRLDAYWRFQWIDIQPSNASGPGLNMNWTIFDGQVQNAINNGQAFNFGIMQNCCTGPSLSGVGGPANCVYPAALHTLMQGEATRDWNNGGGWYENSNSPNWITWFRALHQAVYAHIQSTSFKGVPFKNVVKRIDIRIAGDFGEQAVLSNPPAGVTPTVATFDTLVNAVSNSYPDIYCTSLIGAFAAGVYGFTPAAAGAYALQKRNLAGATGWRWDSWGWTDGIYHSALENNSNVVSGYRFDTAIMNRHKYAPVGGEPADLGQAGNFADLPVRVAQYGAEEFGNGNLDQNNPPNATIQNNFRAAAKAAGYRLVLMPGGSTTTAPASGGPFSIIQHWQNQGGAVPYDNWTITYDLRATQISVPAFTGTSSFNPRLFTSGGVDNVVTDNFTLTNVPAGTYQLNMTVKDPLGYRSPMPVFITNTQQADGSYIIQQNIVVTSSGAVANAGPNQTIVITSATVSGSASTGATSYLWTRISGPNTPTITTPTAVSTTITGMITGTYVFQLAINGGSSGQLIDQIQIIVNAPPVQANAGNNQTITLPTNSATLNGSGSTGATTYAWTQTAGPNSAGITTPTAVSTTVTGLIQGTYTFQLSINSGASTSTVNVTVLPAPLPVANAGASQTITAPTASVTVDGSGSSGTITSYLWSMDSGPNQATFGTATTVSTTVNGLIPGTYVIRLTLNGGAVFDTMRIYVNPSPPPIPTGQTIITNQLPANSPNGTQKDAEGGGLVGIELGAKFRSTVSGVVLGIRFYKTQGNTGTHIGELYSYPGGVLLGQATFLNETPTGWQYAIFNTPIAIAANTTYVTAYFSPNGFYRSTNFGLNTAIVNSPLTLLANGTDGPNGLFKYTNTSAFPNNNFQSSNYWVDILFSAGTFIPCNCHPRYKGQKTIIQ
jgi:Domain of unknown function (DUF4082)